MSNRNSVKYSIKHVELALRIYFETPNKSEAAQRMETFGSISLRKLRQIVETEYETNLTELKKRYDAIKNMSTNDMSMAA